MIAVWLSMAREIRQDIIRLHSQWSGPGTPRLSDEQMKTLQRAAEIYDWLVIESDKVQRR